MTPAEAWNKLDGLTDDEYREARERVRQTFETWIPRLRLQACAFYFTWDRGSGAERVTGEVAMDCKPDWRYLRAEITVFLGSVYEADDTELALMVIHELVHVHLSELSRQDDTGTYAAHEERVCESLTRAFWETYKTGRLSGTLGAQEVTDEQGDAPAPSLLRRAAAALWRRVRRQPER